MKRKTLAFLFFGTLALIANAHEFWLHPGKFFHNVGEKLAVSFKVGENFMPTPWRAITEGPHSNEKVSRVERLDLYHHNGVEDVRARVKDTPENNLELVLEKEGTYMLVMRSTDSFNEEDAADFNAYLKEDGLDDAYTHRAETNTLDKKGKELYARYAKLLVQAGSKTDDTFKKPAGLPIEIMITENPFDMKVGDPVRFKILFEGKPLFGARVKVWSRHQNRTTMQPIYTQQDGTIETHISNAGMWMVSVVKMVPSKDPKADWQSYWGTLVFAIR